MNSVKTQMSHAKEKRKTCKDGSLNFQQLKVTKAALNRERGNATLTAKAGDEHVRHLRRAYVTRKQAKMGSETETATVLTGHLILKYCITYFSLVKVCFYTHDEHKYSQDQDTSQNGNGCTREQVNYG